MRSAAGGGGRAGRDTTCASCCSSRTDACLCSIGDATQDFHEKEPLQDIIDPNFCPRRIQSDAAAAAAKPLKEGKGEMDAEGGDDDDDNEAEDEQNEEDDNDAGARTGRLVATVMRQLRSTYHWLPANVFFGADGTVRFLSDIHFQVRRADPAHAPLYAHLEAGALLRGAEGADG